MSTETNQPIEGEIRAIDDDFSEVYINGQWKKCKKVWKRVQGELEQFAGVIFV